MNATTADLAATIAARFDSQIATFASAEAERIESEKHFTAIMSHAWILLDGADTYRVTGDGCAVREGLRADLSNVTRYTRESAETIAAKINEACPGLDLRAVHVRNVRSAVIAHLHELRDLLTSAA